MSRFLSRTVTRFALAFSVVAAAGAVSPNAEACGGGWWPEVQIDYRVEGVAKAEKQLEQGNYIDAAGSVIRMMPHIRDYQGMSKDSLAARGQRILAMALTRTGGDLAAIEQQVPEYLRGEWSGAKAEHRAANLAWAVASLQAIHDAKGADPAAATELGEAMAKIDAHRDAARKLLGELAKKDLLATPEGYATLAALNAAAGDQAGRTTALERCRAMAASGEVCNVAATTVGNS